MNINESAENYLETILILSKNLPMVRSIDVATELNFKKSSVSVAYITFIYLIFNIFKHFTWNIQENPQILALL